jgi:hypothetical protein
MDILFSAVPFSTYLNIYVFKKEREFFFNAEIISAERGSSSVSVH